MNHTTPIRRAAPADLGAILAIDQASFSQPWSPRSFEAALNEPSNIVLVAQSPPANKAPNAPEAPGAVAAFGVAYTVGDEGEVATLAVDAQWRGRGVGEAVLRALLRECRMQGARQTFLEVRASNAAAQRLYARCGFVAVGRRPAYYADGEDAVIMRHEG